MIGCRWIAGSMIALFTAAALGAAPPTTRPKVVPVIPATLPAAAGVAPLEPGISEGAPAFTPVVSHSEGRWVVPLLFVITGLFAVAAIVGPILHEELSQSIPEAQTFDEPPGSSGHHGPAGTIDLHPPEHPHGAQQ